MSCEIPTKAVVFVYRPVAAAKVPNALRLATEKAEKTILDRYRVKRKAHHVCAAASKLWVLGVPWERALSIVEEAFEAAATEV